MFQPAYSVGFRFSVKCPVCFPLSVCLLLFVAVLGISSEAFGLLLIENTVNYGLVESALCPLIFADNLPL